MKRRYARYVSIGAYSLARLVWIARHNGMLCICADNRPMHFHYEIGLYGTREQLTATEREWTAAGKATGQEHEIAPRRPRGAYKVNLDVAREQWIESELPPVTDEPQGTSWLEENQEQPKGNQNVPNSV